MCHFDLRLCNRGRVVGLISEDDPWWIGGWGTQSVQQVLGQAWGGD